MKLPFKLILDRAFKLIDMIALSKSFEIKDHFKNEYNLYLKECGWTDQEFDEELLLLINNNWTVNLN